jgi:hypothetical protein
MNDDMVRVLRHIAEHFAPPGVQRLDTPFDVPGLGFEDRVAPALRRLAEADPPYVRGVNVAETDYPVVLIGLTERGWAAAEAAGDARDAAPGGAASTPPPTAVAPSGRRFQVALSFAGEQRSYVRRVASALATSGADYFYDDDQKVALWGKNQVEEFQRIYMDDSSSVVMFISSDYAQKSWPIHERRATLSRAMRERREYVLPVRFDDTVLPGLDPDVSYLNADDFTPEKLAEAIVQKLVALGGLVPAVSAATAGWARAAAGRTSTDLTVRVVDDSGLPVSGAQILAVARNGTYVDAHADEGGVATLRLPARRLVTVYTAQSTSAPALVHDHDPANDLEITLPGGAGVGSLIFKAGTGYIPGLTGRLNPIRDIAGESDRYYLYADNISINDQAHQPYPFTPGQALTLEDAVGTRASVTIVSLIGRSSLVRFEQ